MFVFSLEVRDHVQYDWTAFLWVDVELRSVVCQKFAFFLLDGHSNLFFQRGDASLYVGHQDAVKRPLEVRNTHFVRHTGVVLVAGEIDGFVLNGFLDGETVVYLLLRAAFDAEVAKF